MSRYSLFIDDERLPNFNDGRKWIIARDWEDVLMCLRIHGMPGYISFDHDLGADTHTGYDIAKFLVELDQNGDPDFALPEEFDFYVHSQNPVGKRNIECYLNRYLEFKNAEINNDT
jgi:hypothetical protein